MIIENGIFHEVSEDLVKVLSEDVNLLEKWNKLTPIQRNEWICWITIVKKVETRIEHLNRFIEDLQNGKKKPCCWPGCPHRNPNAQKWFSKKQTNCKYD